MIPNISKYEAEKLWNIADLPMKQRVRALKGIVNRIKQADKQIVEKGNNKAVKG